MPLYQYIAVDELGHKIRGQAEAATESALETLLRGQGRWLAEARERSASAQIFFRPPSSRAVPRRVLIEFFLATGLQLKSGVALVDALAFGVQDQAHVGFRMVQQDLLNRVKAGVSFSEALAAHPRTFTPLVISLVRAGESSGRLAGACSEIRRNYEWLDHLVADIRQALLYPAFVLTATLIFLFLVFTYLMPRFAAVLVEIKVKMPWLTQVFLGMSAFMTAHGWAVVVGLVLTVLGLKFVPKWSPAIARALDRLKLSIPVFGPIHHLMCLSRVAQNLATLYRCGIPLLQALQLCRSLVGNRLLEDAMDQVEASVNAGRPMHESMQDNPLFSRLMVQMVAVGEITGSLGDSLQHVSEYYDEVVPREVKKFLSVLEPLMIIGLIVLVGLVALAVFLPMATMLDAK